MNYEPHPAAMLFPMLPDGELRELADDIKANGQIDPIVIYEEKILDGRNRYAACNLVGVDPKLEFANGNISSPVQFVISKNLHRRQLTTSQRAAVAAEMIPMLAEEAKKRELAGKKIDPVLNSEQGETGRSNWIAAKAVQVGHDSVAKALAVKKSAPETFEKIKRGEITVNAAYEGHKEQPKIGGAHIATAPYEITTDRHRQLAESQKRKMSDALALIGGACHGLVNLLDIHKAVAACDAEEIEVWATKSLDHARELKQFAAKLREAKSNGKSA